MSADALISRLDRVKQTGPGRWLARCPAHDDKGPSLSVRELEDGRVLVNCFAGCGADAVVSSIGLQMSDLFPERREFTDHRARRAPRIPAGDVLRAVAHEIRIAACAASDLDAGRELSAEDRNRLSLAARRIEAAVEVCNGRV